MLLVAALPRAATADTVTEQIDPAHTGVATDAPAPPLRERWRVTFDPGYPIDHEVHSALVAGGRVFTTFQKRNGDGPAQVYALDPDDGSTLWERDISGFLGRAGYGNGLVLVAVGGGLHAFHAADGSPAWSRTTWTGVEYPNINSGPLVVGGDTYVVVNGYLFALDTDDGSIEWQRAASSSAGLAAGTVRVFVVQTSSVVALRRTDGAVAWSSPPPPGTSSFWAPQGPTLAGNRLYIPSDAFGAIYDAGTGALVKERLWMEGMLAADADRAYVLSGALYSWSDGVILQAATPSGGATAWEFGEWRGVTSYPLIAGSVVYVIGLNGSMYALDKVTGKPIWCGPTRTSNYDGDPHALAAGDGLLLLPVGGELVALESGGSPGCSVYANAVPGYTDPIGDTPTTARASAARAGAPSGFVAGGTRTSPFVARNRSHVLSVGARGPTLATIPNDELFGVREQISLRVHGGRRARSIRGESPLPGVVNEYRGSDPAGWRRGLRRYRRVRLAGVRPGVDMVVRDARGERFEYDLVLSSGTEPKTVELEFAGAGRPGLDERGRLILPTPAGRLVQPPPRAYQRRDGRQLSIPARFRLTDGGRVGFELGAYDRRRPLVIDPVLEWATYLGGGMDDTATAISSDPSGNVYVAGRTASRDLTGATGFGSWNERNAICKSTDPCHDAFVAKYAPDGSLIHVSYLAGRDNDDARAIAADAAGNAYVTGSTTSEDFPIHSALQPNWRCGDPYGDAFVTKLSPDGTSLAYSTYLGGCATWGDTGTAIAVDSQQRAVVAGYTDALDFPTTAGAADRTCAPADGRCNDGFVARLSASGDKLEWSTYFGGDGSEEQPRAIALDSQGRPVIAGEMADWGTSDFPQTPGSYGSNSPVWFTQAFAARLAADGSAVQWAGAFGGEDWDTGRAVALDADDNVYVAGKTESFAFPTTDDALSRLCDGSTDRYACTNHPDAFVSKLSADGSQLLASTYLGGGGYDDGTGIAIDASGRPYVSGSASSSYGFPLPDAFQPAADGDFDWCAARADCSDAFLVRLDPALSRVDYGTLYGGNSQDVAAGVALAGGDAWISGLTHSSNLATTSSAPQPRWSGGNCQFLRGGLEFPACSDAFVARIDEAKPPAPPPPPPPPPPGDGSGGDTGSGNTGSGDSGGGTTSGSSDGITGAAQTGTAQPGATTPDTGAGPGEGAALPARTVNVKRTLRLEWKGGRLRGRLGTPAAVCRSRATVLLERRVGKQWRRVARARTSAAGGFSFVVPRQMRSLRVRVPAAEHGSASAVTRCAAADRRVPARPR